MTAASAAVAPAPEQYTMIQRLRNALIVASVVVDEEFFLPYRAVRSTLLEFIYLGAQIEAMAVSPNCGPLRVIRDASPPPCATAKLRKWTPRHRIGDPIAGADDGVVPSPRGKRRPSMSIVGCGHLRVARRAERAGTCYEREKNAAKHTPASRPMTNNSSASLTDPFRRSWRANAFRPASLTRR